MIIDEPKHYQKHATTRNPYIVLFGFVTVAGLTHTNGFKKDVFSLNPSNSKSFEYNERGGLMILRTGINSSIGLYLLNFGSGYSAIKETPGAGSYFTIAADNGKITITNIYTGPVGMSIMIVNLDQFIHVATRNPYIVLQGFVTVAEQNHITIGSNAGLRVSYSQTYDTSYYPAAHGSVLRVGDNVKSGIGFELFFGYGGGLWNKNEGENTWKKIL